MKLTMRSFLFITLITLIPVFANAEDLEARFLANHKKLETFQAHFRQTITSPGMKHPVLSEGRFYYLAPDKLRIDYSLPAGDYFLLSGDRFEARRRGKSPDIHNAGHPSARALVSLRDILRGVPPVGDFHKHIEREEGMFRVVLTPHLSVANLPRKIENRVDAKSLALLGMSITMPNGATINFEFEKSLRNQTIDPKIFESIE